MQSNLVHRHDATVVFAARCGTVLGARSWNDAESKFQHTGPVKLWGPLDHVADHRTNTS